MTQNEIIKLAREAGFQPSDLDTMFWQVMERFATLVAAHEREACAKVCDDIDNNMEASWKRNAVNCGAAIRARNNKENK